MACPHESLAACSCEPVDCPSCGEKNLHPDYLGEGGVCDRCASWGCHCCPRCCYEACLPQEECPATCTCEESTDG